MGTTHWFVDETKAGRFVIVVAVVSSASLSESRRRLRALLRPGQRSLHFTKESESVRRAALRMIAESDIAVVVYRVQPKLAAAAARELCLRAIAQAALADGPERVVIERDESLAVHDRRWLVEELGRRAGRSVEFVHLAKHEEPLLWVADAVAWCIQRGRPWTTLISGLSTRTIDLP